MNTTARIVAPPYHVQSTAKELRGGFPYFAHHESVSALWQKKWRPVCAHGIYPFTDGNVADFDPIFAELVSLSNDDPAILYRPDDYAGPFLPVGERLVAQAEAAAAQGKSVEARDLFLRAATVFRIARFPINRSVLGQDAWNKGKSAYEKGGALLDPPASPSPCPSASPTLRPAIATRPSRLIFACPRASDRRRGGLSCSSSAGSTPIGPTTRRARSNTSTAASRR